MIECSYEEIRQFITDGDLIFIRDADSFTSKLIRLFTRSKYSHVGIAFWATIGGEDRLMVVEAQGGTKRRLVNMSMYARNNIDVIRAPRDWTEYADKALENIGVTDYGWIEALYVGIREGLLNYFDVTLSPRDLPGEICSEFVAGLLELTNPHVSPQGLARALAKIGHTVQIQIKGPSSMKKRARKRTTRT